jgi:transposase
MAKNKEDKRFNELRDTVVLLRQRNWDLEGELSATRAVLYQNRDKMDHLQQQWEAVRRENRDLKQRLEELTAAINSQTKTMVPAFVKANVPQGRRQRPGRKIGHAAAHRPLPQKIDTHIEVAVPHDDQGMACCPECRTQLSDVQKHDRIVEDIIPAKVLVTCYHTTSGYCPSCRKVMESRAPQQPPAADVPQGQLGLNTLATAALLRMQYHLPYRPIAQLLEDLPGLSISPGAIARQIQRMGGWLEGQYDRLKVLLRASPVVHMDETGWRTDGRNGWLWAMLSDQHAVYHVDKSRGHKVVHKLLGKEFDGTLVTDFYGAYGKVKCDKQKCLVHLLRELRDTAAKSPEFATGAFHRRCRRLVKELLRLKKQKGQMEATAYEAQGQRLERQLKKLAEESWDEPHATRLAKRLKRHPEEFTRFLWHDEVDGTNNAAERAIRPAVVARKISGGSRSAKGARATAILMSILRTAHQQGHPLFETIKTLLMASWAGKNPGLLTDILANPV